MPFARFLILAGLLSASAPAACVAPPGSVLRVALAPDSPKSAAPGGVLAGSLDRPVYSGSCLVVPKGTPVRAVVERVEKHRLRPPVLGWIRWAWGARAEAPSMTLREARIGMPGPGDLSIAARAVRIEWQRHREASKDQPAGERRRMMLLETVEAFEVRDAAPAPQPEAATLPAGTRMRIDLLTPLDSASTRQGDAIQAVVAEPVMLNGQVVVPQGAVVSGVVSQSRRARRIYRAGRMRVSFRSLRLPSGRVLDVAAPPSAGDFAGATKLDTEGGLTGGALNRKQALLNIGIAYATGKILDDLVEEAAKGAYGAAVAGSAETAARYVGLGAGAFMFLMHRGREVRVEERTLLEVTLARDLRIQP